MPALIVRGGPHAPGSRIEIEVHLVNEGSNVVAAQLDIDFPATLTPQPMDARLGPAAASAGKSFNANMMDSDTLRVLIFGFNQNTMPDGALLTIPATIHSGASPGAISITPTNVRLSTPAGASIGARSVGASIQVASSGGGEGGGSGGDSGGDGGVDPGETPPGGGGGSGGDEGGGSGDGTGGGDPGDPGGGSGGGWILRWAHPTPGAMIFKVYRGSVVVHETTTQQFIVRAADIAPGVHRYSVTATDPSTGLESDPSNEVVIEKVAPQPPRVRPIAPTLSVETL